MRSSTTAAAILLLTLLLTSCSGSDDSESRFSLIEEDGVTVALTTGGPLYPSILFTFEPVLTLKEDPSREESLLARSLYFTIGPNDHYYVPDLRANDIAVFDSGGDFLFRFGREGEGPGEFRSVTLPRIEGDMIYIFDFHLQRLCSFQLDGTLIEDTRPPVGARILDLFHGPEGILIFEGISAREEGNIGYTNREMTVVSANGDTIAEIATSFIKENMLSRIEVMPGEFSTLSQDIPYSPYPSIFHVPGRGILATDGDKPELILYDLQGNIRRIIRAEIESHPITTTVRARFEERRWQARIERARERGTEPGPLPDYPYPESCGFWGRGMVDDAGWIWLEDVWASYEKLEEEDCTFHVFDPDGRYMGTALLPVDYFHIARGRLMCIIEDPETGADVPTVFQIVPNVTGLIYP